MRALSSAGVRAPAWLLPGGLAVDGDDVRIGIAQVVDPRCEAGLEVLGQSGR